jgi:hypothetical protein
MIPVVDVDLSVPGAWGKAFHPHRKSMNSLLSALDAQVSDTIGTVTWWGVKKAIGVGGALYGNLHGDECEELAEVADVAASDIRAANLAYDIAQAGCSTLAVPQEVSGSPLLARNLDWSLGSRNLLQRTLTVARISGAHAGDYVSVLWPGLFGGLTAMAPGRFSLAINFVVHSDVDASTIATSLAAGAMPVTWATRHVLDHCKDFDAAVKYLRRVELGAPVLFTLAGTKAEERVVIERSPDASALRKPPQDGRPVLVTNHYVSKKFEDWNGADDDLTEDSAERYAGVDAGISKGASSPTELFKVLSRRDVIRSNTQYQVAMSAADGVLHCRLPGGRAQKVTM